MWVGLIQLVEGFKNRDWGFLKKAFYLKTLVEEAAWVSDLMDCRIQTQD